MAQGDLYRLLSRVSNALAKDMDSKSGGSERFRARIDRYPHDVYLDKDQIKNEILIQLQDFNLSDNLGVTQGVRQTLGSSSGRTREESALAVQNIATAGGLTPAQIKVAETEAATIVKLAAKLVNERRRGIQIKKISGDGTNTLVLRFSPTNKTAIVYDAVNDLIFKPAKQRLAKNLAAAKFNISADRQRRILNVGHVTAVSTLKGARALGAINSGLERINSKYDDPLPQEAADALRVGIFSKFTQIGNPEYAKEFLIRSASVKPESEATNLTDSDYEAALLRDVRKSIESTLKSLPNDWAGQKSSDSLIDVLTADLMDSMKPSGKNIKRVGPKPKKKQTQSSREATQTVKVKKPKAKKPQGLKIGKLLDTPTQSSSPVSLLNLIPLINQRLPEVIRSHMGTAGRLVNRTGRFSESAEVVALDKDNFTLSYTYQLSPYQVFESQGARDPRPLIEQSVREIARGLIAQRFSLRRI